jgi:AcrR family transcriptional regulator
MSDSSENDGLPSVKKGDQYHHPDLREAMIRVAQELLESEGPGSWTVRAAARIAGVSSGAPYRHFADKDALLAAVAARGFDELRVDIEAKLTLAGDSAVKRLHIIGESYVEFAAKRPGRYQVMFGRDILNRKSHLELSAAADKTFDLLMGEVRRAQQLGFLRADRSAEHIAAAAWAMAHGLSDLLLSGRLAELTGTLDVALTTELGRMMFEGLLFRGSTPP